MIAALSYFTTSKSTHRVAARCPSMLLSSSISERACKRCIRPAHCILRAGEHEFAGLWRALINGMKISKATGICLNALKSGVYREARVRGFFSPVRLVSFDGMLVAFQIQGT